MQIPVTSGQYVFVPLYGPPGVDLTQYPVQLALVLEDAGEPAPSAYQPGYWIKGQAALPVAAGSYPPGDYMAFAKVTAGDEVPVIQSGRVRIGDGISPAGTPGAPAATWVTSVNGKPGAVNLTAADVGAVPSTGGAVTGTLILSASPVLKVPGAGSGFVLVSDDEGNITPQALTASGVGADPAGSAEAAQEAAQEFAASAASAAQEAAQIYAAGQAGAAQAAAESFATSEASAAQSAAETYADSQAGAARSAAETFATSAAGTAQAAAESYAAEQASSAQAAAETYAAPKANPTFTGTVTVPATVNATDAAQKAYVDSVAQGLDAKPSAKVVAAAGITLSGTQTIDGVAVAAGDRVLATGQATGSQNGLWAVAAGAWTRPADFASGSSQSGSYVFVEGGTAGVSSGWTLVATSAVTVDTSSQTWTQFSGAGEIQPGANLVKVGNTLSVATSAALGGTPTAATAPPLTSSTQLATTGYADAAVAFEASRAATAEGLAAAKANNLADLANRQTALNTIAGAVTAGQYPRGNGVNVQMSAIHPADLPTLDQVPNPTAAVSLNNQKIANLANGTTTGHAAAYAQIQEAFNVKGYGAVGNGSAPDDVWLQNAINAAAVAGGVVFLPPGSYKLTVGLLAPSSVTFKGAGALKSTLRPAAGVVAITVPGVESTGPGTFTATSSSPCVFTLASSTPFGGGLPNGISVHLSGGSLPAGFTAGPAYYAVNVNMAALTFELAATFNGTPLASTSAGSGSVTAGSAQVTQTVFEDFGIVGAGQGVGTAPGMALNWCTTGTRLHRMYVTECGGDGIQAVNSYSVSMRDCFLTYNGGNGLNAQSNINSWDMSGNTADGNTLWGYYIMGGAASVLHCCDAESNGYGGTSLLGTFAFNLEGCELEDNGSTVQTDVITLTATPSALSQIGVVTPVTGLTVTDTTSGLPLTYGTDYTVTTSGSGASVTYSITRLAGSTSSTSGDQVSVSYKYATGQACGIYIGAGSGNYGLSQNTRISGNLLQGTAVANYGIVVDGAVLTEISGNYFANNLLNDIVVTANATATLIRHGNYTTIPAAGHIADAGTSTQYMDYDTVNHVMRSSGLSFGTVAAPGTATILPGFHPGQLVISGNAPTFGAVLRVTNTQSGVGVPAHYVTGIASTDLCIGTAYAGAAFLPFQFKANGQIGWGPGTSTVDTFLARTAAGQLQAAVASGALASVQSVETALFQRMFAV